MPFLTRDFAVFLGLVAFLLSGIIVTGFGNWSVRGQTASVIEFNEVDGKYEAVLAEDDTSQKRSNELRDMTDKVKERLASLPAAVIKPEVTESAKKPDSDRVDTPGVVLTCNEYATVNPVWQPAGLKFDLVEGALIVYREKVVEVTDEVSATGTQSSVSSVERDVVLQLPYRSYSSNQQVCLSSDVVGIALDGSLIRNSDYTAYQIFGSETQIGYALDGFPIYGTANFATDTCGGSDDSGFYRYYLNKDRKGILGCFSSTPVAI